jgi:hypothetical protein
MGSPAQVKTLSCPNCGGGVELRGYARTLNVVCINCLSVLDASTPELKVLQTFQSKERVRPLIPLGKRGKLRGDKWEAIGFQVREIVVDGTPYSWHEYLLFNPYKGYRYLTQYDGHWNFVTTLRSLPEPTTARGRPAVRWMGETYKHFQEATAATVYVMGEFPWQVRVGETAKVSDYVSPPRMISSETTDGEVTWSLGEYTPGEEIWKAFELPGKPPPPQGVYANQPSPHGEKVKAAWKTWLFLNVLLFTVMLLVSLFTRGELVFDRSYLYSSAAQGEASFVTEPFELKGRISNVELAVKTDLRNESAYFNFALINEATGQAYDFGREVSYYFGRDSDGSWSEGRPQETVIIPSVPPGRYYLRVEPEMEPQGATLGFQDRRVNYRIQIRRDVPNHAFFWIAALLLLAPPVFTTLRSVGFESKRWKESDYSGGSGDAED